MPLTTWNSGQIRVATFLAILRELQQLVEPFDFACKVVAAWAGIFAKAL